jgi:hypothetical protein
MAKRSFLKSLKTAFTRITSRIGLKKCRTRRASRKANKSNKSKRNQRGGGYSEKLDLSIYPGQQVHQAYGGPGYDCAGTATRPGTLDSIGMLQNPGGLPGLSPGLLKGGGSQLGSGGPVVMGGRRRKARRNQNGGTVLGVSVADASYPGTPSSNTPAQNFPQENAVPANVNAARAPQMGGRYGMEGSPLDPVNGVGMSGYAQIGRVPCEAGTRDGLNLDPTSAAAPMGVQELTTNTMTYGIPGFTKLMNGGGRRRGNNTSKRGGPLHRRGSKHRKTKNRSQKKKNKQRGGVVVGQVDAMRYYAPTAGYSNLPLVPQVPNNPGILMQLGYPAGHFNEACLKTN